MKQPDTARVLRAAPAAQRLLRGRPAARGLEERRSALRTARDPVAGAGLSAVAQAITRRR